MAAAPSAEKNESFAQMKSSKKLQFVAKLALFLVTFGFAFANILSD